MSCMIYLRSVTRRDSSPSEEVFQVKEQSPHGRDGTEEERDEVCSNREQGLREGVGMICMRTVTDKVYLRLKNSVGRM